MGSIVNFALMYLLAPTGTAAAGAAGASLITKIFSEQTLVGMGAPGEGRSKGQRRRPRRRPRLRPLTPSAPPAPQAGTCSSPALR